MDVRLLVPTVLRLVSTARNTKFKQDEPTLQYICGVQVVGGEEQTSIKQDFGAVRFWYGSGSDSIFSWGRFQFQLQRVCMLLLIVDPSWPS